MFLSTVRLEELVDSYVEKTVKFVYVHWIGDNVPFTKKGKFGVVHGSVQKHFQVTVKTSNGGSSNKRNIAEEKKEIIYGVLRHTSSCLTLNHLIIIGKYFLFTNVVGDEK